MAVVEIPVVTQRGRGQGRGQAKPWGPAMTPSCVAPWDHLTDPPSCGRGCAPSCAPSQAPTRHAPSRAAYHAASHAPSRAPSPTDLSAAPAAAATSTTRKGKRVPDFDPSTLGDATDLHDVREAMDVDTPQAGSLHRRSVRIRPAASAETQGKSD